MFHRSIAAIVVLGTFVVGFAACSSSSNAGTSGTQDCSQPSSDPNCNSCLSANCSAEVKASQTACASWIQAKCSGTPSTDCQTSINAGINCAQTKCATQCPSS